MIDLNSIDEEYSVTSKVGGSFLLLSGPSKMSTLRAFELIPSLDRRQLEEKTVKAPIICDMPFISSIIN